MSLDCYHRPYAPLATKNKIASMYTPGQQDNHIEMMRQQNSLSWEQRDSSYLYSGVIEQHVFEPDS